MKEYCVPFHDKLPPSPSFEEVKRLVVDEKVRPEIPNTWYQDKVMLIMPAVSLKLFSL